MITLTDDQKHAVRQWVAEGTGLSAIQKRLSSDFSITMTYMDVRFLLIDLGLDLQDPAQTHTEKKPEADIEADTEADTTEARPEDALLGGVTVSLDAIVQPGAMVSGNVTFSDGRDCRWFLDQTGRLGLDADGDRNYRPAPDDIQQFQQKLQELLATRGY